MNSQFPKIYICPDCKNPPAAEYALRFLLDRYYAAVKTVRRGECSGLRDGCLVYYGAQPVSPVYVPEVFIQAADDFWANLGKPESLPTLPLARIPVESLRAEQNERLQSPIALALAPGEESSGAEWSKNEAGYPALRIRDADIVASCFFWITRYEETFSVNRDEKGRYNENKLLSIREGLNLRPLADEYSELLRQWLTSVGIELKVRRDKPTLLITHDIDSDIQAAGSGESFRQGIRFTYGELRKRRIWSGFNAFMRWLPEIMRLRSNRASFQKIIEFDRRRGFTPRFFIMANGTHKFDAVYDIASEPAKNVIDTIRSRSGSIGYHIGIDAHDDFEQMRREYTKLAQAVNPARVIGARSHHLMFSVPETWRKLRELAIGFDSSMGFSQHMGFRCGTSHPYKPYDFEKSAQIDIYEYPLLLMDKSLVDLRGADFRAAEEQITELVKAVKAHRGCLVLNWHNVYFFGYPLKIYSTILKAARDFDDEDLNYSNAGSI